MKRIFLPLLASLMLAASFAGAPTWAADKKPLKNEAGQIKPFGTGDTVPVALGGTAATTASGARTALGVAVGSDVQAYDPDLAAIAGVTSAADKVPYFTGSGTASVATFTSAGRAIVDDADASAQRTTLGLGTFATQSAPTGSTQCLHADTAGVVTGTGSDCGAGGGGASITVKEEGSNLTTALTSIDLVGAAITGTNTGGAVTITSTAPAMTTGTFTPGVAFGGGATGITYTTQVGRYTRMGNIVTATLYIKLSNKGSSTGNITLTGLPFTTKNTTNYEQTASIGVATGAAGTFSPHGWADPNTTVIKLYDSNSASFFSNAFAINTSEFIAQIIYECEP